MPEFYDYRLKFSKNGPVRFVGHLDVMRYFQKANRRAGLPMRYSEGFSPHQIMSFALPLSVGATSDGEYLDMSLVRETAPEEIIARLNNVMHEGIEARACRPLPEHSPKAMTVIAAAKYHLSLRESALPCPAGEYADHLRDFLNREQILTEKKTKKGVQQVDLKPLIHESDVREDGSLLAILHAGSKDHVKPALLYEAFHQANGCESAPNMLKVHRIDLYEEQEGRLVPLIETDPGADAIPQND